MGSSRTGTPFKIRIGLGVLAFILLSGVILSQPVRKMQDFDQPFYITVAYDLYRWGVFGNGIVGDSESRTDTDSSTRPAPGMFFGPVYPALVFAAMKLDPHFAEAVRCSVSADRDDRDNSACVPDALPMRFLNAALLAGATVAVASTGELIFAESAMFLLTGVFALAALAFEFAIFSYIMTEATIFSLYSFFALANVVAWRIGRTLYFALSGLLLGILCLTKPSFLLFFPLAIVLGAVYFYLFPGAGFRRAARHLVVFSLAFGCIVGAWMTRNYVSVGKFALTEEYGAAALIERFAYDDMSLREFLQAFPYCMPGIGELAFGPRYAGDNSMHRFVWWTKGGFFDTGRERRNALTEKYGRLDSLIRPIVIKEMRANWWRYLLVSIPLGWCGMWTGQLASLLLLPLFAWACIRCVRRRQPLFLLYAAPPIANLVLDALVGNESTRYNLILIGPYAIGAASIIAPWLGGVHWRRRARASGSSAAPSAPAISDANSTSPIG